MGDKITSTLILKVDLSCARCNKKIRKVLDNHRDRWNIEAIDYDEKKDIVRLIGSFDTEKLIKKLCGKACKVIKEFIIPAPPPPPPPPPPSEPDPPPPPPPPAEPDPPPPPPAEPDPPPPPPAEPDPPPPPPAEPDPPPPPPAEPDPPPPPPPPAEPDPPPTQECCKPCHMEQPWAYPYPYPYPYPLPICYPSYGCGCGPYHDNRIPCSSGPCYDGLPVDNARPVCKLVYEEEGGPVCGIM